jgi:hypothetical protein
MKFLNHNLFTGDITVNGTTTLSTATGITRATGDNSTHLATTEFVKAQGYATTAALSGYVPITRTITINGTTLDLSADRTWTIEAAGTVRTVYETVKNASGATILKGTPLSVMPGQTSGNVSDVQPADASDPTKMPAVFIANENIADEAEGEAVLFGNLTGVNTAAYTPGTTVYVAPGGGWTATKPVWPNKIQNLGVITKQHATNGAGIVTGVGRANDLPNLTAGKIWVGSANYPIESTTVHVDEANGRVGIGTTSPSTNLHVAGNTRITGSRFDLETNTRITGQYYGNGGAEYTYINMYNAGDASINIGTKHPLSYISFESGNGAYTERMRITNTGNVGIGTTAPTAMLNVANSGRALAVFRIQGTNRSAFYDNDFAVNNDGGGADGFIYGSNSAGGAFPFNGYGEVIIQANPRTGYANGISFVTGTTSPSVKMRVTEGGNIGVGTISPASKLHIYQSNSEGIYLDGLQEYTTFKMLYGGNQKAEMVYQYSSDQLYFNKFGTGSFAFYGGNVGIGITPSNKLQVANGDMSITTGYSFILADTDTNWRIGRNIIVENGNQLTANTMQFVAANTANEGWQFVDDDGNTRFEIGASTGTAWLSSGNLYLNGNLAATQSFVTSQGYITGYTESDTLATVTGRGATTNTSITVGPDLIVQADGSVNYTASRLWLNSHNNYRGAGVHMSGVGSTWFAGTPYTDFDGGYVIARTGTSNDVSSAQYSNALLTVKSSGNVGIGTASPSY